MKPMRVAEPPCFLDSNILLYLLSADRAKADCVECLLKARPMPIISVQVLNEVTHVCRRKLDMPWDEIDVFWQPVRRVCKVEAVTEAVHDDARLMAARYHLSFYDACIVAAAMTADCRVLFSEDMQDGQVLAGKLTIRNPFSMMVSSSKR